MHKTQLRQFRSRSGVLDASYLDQKHSPASVSPASKSNTVVSFMGAFLREVLAVVIDDVLYRWLLRIPAFTIVDFLFMSRMHSEMRAKIVDTRLLSHQEAA